MVVAKSRVSRVIKQAHDLPTTAELRNEHGERGQKATSA